MVYGADTGAAYSQLNIQSYFKVHSATSSEPQTADTEELLSLVLQKSKSVGRKTLHSEVIASAIHITPIRRWNSLMA